MATPATPADLFDILRMSGLVSESTAHRAELRVSELNIPTAADAARHLVVEGLLTPFQANHLLAGRYKNFFIGKFKVLQPLGSGGASQVFLCEHTVLKHRRAIKLLQQRDTSDKATLNRFFREARAAASVHHPNVVRAHDVDQAEGKYHYMVMDYVDGVNLHNLVQLIGPLSPEHAAQYISQAAAGLQHIYECGLIHRDIKPSNLLVDRTGVVKILDLGLARFQDDERDNLTQQYGDRSVMGTADYLAPEQALQAKNLDIRADIYGLGMTFYFLLTGRAPFEGQTVAQKLLHHQFKDPPRPERIPDALWSIIAIMISKRPDDRYATPGEVVVELADWTALPLPPPDESWFAGLPTLTTAPPSGGPPPTGVRSNKTKMSSRMLMPEPRSEPQPTPSRSWLTTIIAVIIAIAATVLVMRAIQ
jgi:eukaryotic-like serine/threonine-protein kinase